MGGAVLPREGNSVSSSVKLRTASAIVGLAAIAALTVLPASAVSAAPVVGTAVVADPPNFTPSTSGPRKYMLNILGRLLGKSMPSAWRAEQLANQYQYNQSWEYLENQFGYDSTSSGPYTGLPDTYDDYVIAKTEQDLKGGTNGVPMAPPATGPSKLVKTVAGAAAVVSAFSLGVTAGNAGLEMFGFDADGAVCGHLDGPLESAVNLITGTDCAQYDFDQTYVPNAGVVPDLLVTGECLTPQSRTAGVAVGTPTCSAGNARKYNFVTGSSSSQGIYSPVRITAVTTTPIVGGALAGRLSLTVTASSIQTSGKSAQENITGVSVSPYCVTSAGNLGNPYAGTNWRPTDDGYPTNFSFTSNPQTGSTPTNCASVVLLFSSVQADGSHVYGVAYRPGYALPPSGLSEADPERTLVCTILGTDGHEYTQTSAPFRESDGALAQPQCPTLPSGVAPANVQLDETGNGTSETLLDQDVTDEYLAWWNDYPECRTGACKLDLIDLRNPSFPVSCFDLDDACNGWFESPTRADDYECHYGIHTVELEECFVYSGVFDPARLVSGAPYSDPLTGTWSGGQNAPTPDAQALGQEIQNPESARACRGLAAANFDPVAFVMRPVQCALEWAFVPRDTVLKYELAKVQGAWDASFLGEVGGIVGQFSDLPVYTGCDGVPIYIEFEWPIEWVMDWNFGESCTGPLKTTADIVRVVESVGLVLLGIRALSRYFGGVIGFRGFGGGDAA